MRRVLLIPTIVLLILGVGCYWLSASRAPGSGAEKPIVMAIQDDIQTLDPGRMSWMNDIRAATALWEGLTAYDPDTLAPVPGIAKSWDISADGKTYTFHLRDDAHWSNGDLVTAKDFVFAWRRVLTPATGAEYIGLFKGIVGAEEYTKALAKNQRADFAKVGIEAPDPFTVIVSLRAPCTYFLDLCAFAPFFPLNEEAMKPFRLDRDSPCGAYDGHWSRPPHLVTNGPYVLKEWKFKDYLSLVPNRAYWDRKNVRCSNVVIRSITDSRASLLSYQQGGVDVLTAIPPQFGDDLIAQQDRGERQDIHYGPVFGSYYFIFNCAAEAV